MEYSKCIEYKICNYIAYNIIIVNMNILSKIFYRKEKCIKNFVMNNDKINYNDNYS